MPEQQTQSFILYEDSQWLVVNKPTGVSTHGAEYGDLGAVEWLSLHHHKQLFVCSRLDKGTSGVLLFAKTKECSARAQTIHESDTSQKIYHFLSHKDSQKEFGKSQWLVTTPLDDRPAHTRFKNLGPIGDYYLYSATLHRGRKHQVRRHATESKIPILGDNEYAGQPFPRLCLHCSILQWPEIENPIEAPLPPSFQALKRPRTNSLPLALCADRRLGWLPSITNAFRVVHREEIDSLDYAAEVYGNFLSVWSYDEKTPVNDVLATLKPQVEALMHAYQCKGALVRFNNRNPHEKKLVRASEWVGQPMTTPFTIQEHNLVYQVQLHPSKHPGLFLDQRDSRRRLAQIVSQKRMANLFAFTCSFSQVAVSTGAEVAFSIDLAKGCLDVGKTNLAMNGLSEKRIGKFVQGDVRKWLQRQVRKQIQQPESFLPFDVIVCDPPVFASAGKGKSFSVAKEWNELVASCKTILQDKGIAIFANNHRSGEDDFYLSQLQRHFDTVHPLRPPLDFPQCKNTHVRTYWCF